MDENQLHAELVETARSFGAGQDYNSDCFYMLAAILAYYEERGTKPQDMLSPTLLTLIAWIRAGKP